MNVVLIVRSVVFNILFYLNLTVYLIAAIPTLWMPYRCIVEVAKSWGRTSNWLLRVICGIHVEIRGLEKIPTGPLLVASKHQSTWETFALLPLFNDPAFILKRELLWLPLFGWYAWKGQMIPVNRGTRNKALAAIGKEAAVRFAGGRQIIIFPEGTRRPAGAAPDYKYGVVHLYAETGVTCLPVALNSGLYWPRRSWLRYPGTIRLEILDPIAPGLGRKEFANRLRGTIEEATARLIAEGERELMQAGYPVRTARHDPPGSASVPPDGEAPPPDNPAPRAL